MGSQHVFANGVHREPIVKADFYMAMPYHLEYGLKES